MAESTPQSQPERDRPAVPRARADAGSAPSNEQGASPPRPTGQRPANAGNAPLAGGNRPAAAAGTAAKPTAATSTAKPVPRMGFRPRRRVRTWLESTLSELRRFSLGTLISLGVHALLLGLLALYVLREPTEDFSSLLGGWSSRAARRNREPLPIPVEISPVAPVGPVPRAGAKTPSELDAGALPTPVRAPTQVAVQGALAARSRDLPRPQRFELGSTAESETAVDRGLAWLARQQADDGHWSLDRGYPDPGSLHTDTGATALALLCFLGAGHTTTVGDHASQVAKGVEWLLSVQKRGGEQSGDFYDSQQEGENASFYAHAQATMALAELLVLEPTPRLRQAVEAGLGYIHAAQHPRTGGWKYRAGSEGDLSVFGWQLLALQTGRMAGLQPPPGVLERASGFLDLVQLENGSRYRYEPTSRSGSTAMTAEGLLCRQYLGWPADHPALRDGVRFLLEEPQRPRWQAGRRNVYQWYYTAQVLHNLQGEEWRTWEEELRRELVLNQVKSGRQALGSWHPRQPPGHPDENADKGGRLYLTCLCVLCLEVNYRHLPLYQLADDAAAAAAETPTPEPGPGNEPQGNEPQGKDPAGKEGPGSEAPANEASPSDTPERPEPGDKLSVGRESAALPSRLRPLQWSASKVANGPSRGVVAPSDHDS